MHDRECGHATPVMTTPGPKLTETVPDQHRYEVTDECKCKAVSVRFHFLLTSLPFFLSVLTTERSDGRSSRH